MRAEDYRAPLPIVPESWLPLWKSFARNLRASDRSERTLKAYAAALTDLAHFLDPAPPIAAVSRQQLEEFMAAFQIGHQPGYVAIHYRGLRRFFNWLVEEEELAASPMKRIKLPKVPDEPPTVLDLGQLRKLLEACRGQGFEARRDMALLRFLLDTGVRLGGVTAMTVNDVDLDRQRVRIRAKGGDFYSVPLGAKAVRDLDRYLRARAGHRLAHSPAVWLGMAGPMTESGIYQIVRRRSRLAGLKVKSAVHAFRHSFSHHYLAAGGEEGDLMVLGGWKSRAMLARYGRSHATERARAAHRRFSPGDQV